MRDVAAIPAWPADWATIGSMQPVADFETTRLDAPLRLYRDVVRPAWIDYNQHMNVGYYGVAFDHATDALLDFIGLDAAHRAQHRVTTFSLESHFTYQREVVEGDALYFESRILAFDTKRIHYFHWMYRESDAALSATNELMSLHVSELTRRSAPIHESVLARVAAIASAQAGLPDPAEAGRVIGLRARPTTTG